MTYHCPVCNASISFGESICPKCNADVTSVWDQINKQEKGPSVIPGAGFSADGEKKGISPINSPFPPVNGNVPNSNPFSSPTGENSPFQSGASSPFSSGEVVKSPFSSDSSQDPGSNPFPPLAKSFPPKSESNKKTGAYLEIPRIGGKIFITENPLRIGRDEIQGTATISLPDLNAYKNISRKRADSEHFIIHQNNGQYLIEDINSTNGTYLGTTKLGKGIVPQILKDGDKIIIPIEEFGKMVQLEVIFKTN